MPGVRFAGVVAVVTGAASGIGRAIAELIVAEGGRVVLADVDEVRGPAVAEALGPVASFLATDVSDEAAVAAAVRHAVVTFGRVDLMCNNAGVLGPDDSITETSAADWDRVLGILLKGTFFGTKHAARVMVEQGSGGSIVNISSIAGTRGGLGPHLYTVAKHGIIGLTRSAAAELGAHGVRVNCVAPGAVPTAMSARFGTGDPDDLAGAAERISASSPLGQAPSPRDVAEAVAYLAALSGGYVNGQTIVVDAGVTTAVPRRPTGTGAGAA